MNQINYSDYNVDLILSTEKNTNKRNLIKINGKYYFQIRNIYEDNLENNDEANYCEDIQIEENGSYAKIVSLNDLYNICKYFQLKDEVAAVLIFQFLKFQKIDEILILFFEQSDKKDVLKFIQKHNHMVLS
ncbi:hypothetical protein TTHERM_00242630 (macronuclear) [Tetrahymena thermophila SB210]|uniref:Uncharacterized protein n=1 Tax=Tetrahymena thermophila (strain SB210) TaxID=312017 RepID=I7MAK0_TETTS|nr:hypothetical protein TTHERM_00242630 [Tetrahymena thermophila SB210]EAS04741.1 hypothetical protein TTHERM_00242630 [Tetrahymena thermophila SB210]|eukprot:XP_001024986.1 hypothetical protein TTHERM_00242630 [Tetrahymena thermophila SB210]